MAIEKWNQQGGIHGKKIELIALDDQLVPDKAANNMQQLLDDKSIVAIIGPAGSGPALATVPLTEVYGIIQINPVAQTTDVTYPNGVNNPPRKTVFSFALQNDVETDVLATFAGEQWKKDRPHSRKYGIRQIRDGIGRENIEGEIQHRSGRT